MEPRLTYLATGLLSYLAVTVLERLASGFEGQMLRTEIYSIHGFSHLFFGIGLTSAVLLLRPRSSARLVIVAVLVAGILWELYEGLWLAGEPLDSLEDVMLGILSASAFLCYVRGTEERDDWCQRRGKYRLRNVSDASWEPFRRLVKSSGCRLHLKRRTSRRYEGQRGAFASGS